MGACRTYLCPPWVKSLQQAELFAVYEAQKVAVGNRLGGAVIGINNDAARIQSHHLWAAPKGERQHRVLRRMFWLRAWSGLQVATFRVASADNPADPLSRTTQLPSWRAATAEAERRHTAWGLSVAPYEGFRLSPPLPSVLH